MQDTSQLARQLADQAEAVCRQYLSNGHREGRYWLVGDVRNTPGRSLFVRLTGSGDGKGAAGKWTDAATGEHGDLLDVIREAGDLRAFRDVIEEARRFLGAPPRDRPAHPDARPPARSPDAARRLFAMAKPIAGTIVETYLRTRGIVALHETASLRYHPNCYYRPKGLTVCETRPAMIAAVTDLDGRITGVHRTWLDPSGKDKAVIDTPRRAMGHLLGHGVRFGVVRDVMTAGEGIETILSLRGILPAMPMIAALSAAHLAALIFPPTLERLYVARDSDPVGIAASNRLIDRAQDTGIDAVPLSPQHGDFNEDLRAFGHGALWAAVRPQILPEDVARFTDHPSSNRL